MTEIQLGYGKGSLDFAFTEDRYHVISGTLTAEKPLTDVEIGEALSAPIQSPQLEDLFSDGDSVLIVVSDATRATASAQILNLLVRRLIQIGVSPADLAIIFATGIHRPVTPEEKVELLTPFIAQRIKTINHSAHDASQMIQLGTTDLGTPIELNRALKDFSHVIITGAIGFHYFAGFTGGRKAICPGLASTRTIEATHKLALDFAAGGRRAGVGTALLDGNAVHQECERVAALIAPCFSINSVVDERGRALHIYAGEWRAAHRVGCQDYLASHSVEIGEKREVVIVSCGGAPYDLNLIQAHKALDMAAHACRDGGTIVLVAQCPDGLGYPTFLKWFEEENSRALETRLRDAYEVNGQTAWSLLTKAERYRILLVSDLPDEVVRTLRIVPARSLTEALGDVDREMPGYIMPHGARFLPRSMLG
ncbi:MAG TPA: nickel-dependent lactate racemase [Pyrinomonadaceae bacterium]|jgi:nickel-dependent lactate racemase|nr:nickel-dependent lactate racemase [Pyrinomonadaceae bacterium]